MANPFYIQPAQYGDALSGLGQSLAAYGQQRQQQQAMDEQQQREAETSRMAQEAFASGDPNKVAEFAVANPQYMQVFDKAFGWTEGADTKPIVTDTYRSIISDPENAQFHLQRGIESVQAAGGNPQNMMNDLGFFQENPEAALQSFEMAFAGMAPNEYAAYQSITKPEETATLPAAVQESQWFLNLPDSEKAQVLEYKGRGGPGYVEKKEIDRASKILENPAQYSDEEVAAAQDLIGSNIPIAQQLYGGLSSDKANALYTQATEAEQSWNQLSRSMNLLEDMKDAGVSLKGANAQNFMQTWFGEVLGMDSAEAARQAAAVESGNFDIARQLAQALRPVSEKQLEIVLKSLEGGNIDSALQALRGTAKQSQGTYERTVKQLMANKAGIVSDFPTTLEYKRTPNVVRTEDVEFGNEPPASIARPDYDPSVPQVQAPQGAIEALRANPELRDQFMAKYGYIPGGM